MGFLFGAEPPAPAPLPLAPSTDPAAEAARLNKEREALADRAAGGRRSTIVGGMKIAEEEQLGRGQAAAERRKSSTLG